MGNDLYKKSPTEVLELAARYKAALEAISEACRPYSSDAANIAKNIAHTALKEGQ